MTTMTTDVKTVADVLRFVFAHRAAGTIPEGWRSETEPEKPDNMTLRQPSRPFSPTDKQRAEYEADLAAYRAEREVYDAAYDVWKQWSAVGRWFQDWNGGPHRQATSVEPSALYPITARALGVSESKAKTLVRDATMAGDLVRLGSGNAVTYTLPEVVEAREQGYADQDARLRALAERARSVGLDVAFRYRESTSRAHVVQVSLTTPLERLVEMLEQR